ncbi:RnfH family protein [Hydrogenophaga sp.]|uniref:RnfH family protein n=1 Tax=Hydrogenophaga sp. TaxID=1904254 RepID=UPI0025BEFC9A|nr:RnfH family protein [Hydrogenophaga sp.]
MKITLAHASAPRTVHELVLTVPDGCTVAQALEASGWSAQFPGLMSLPVGIWNRRALASDVLREGDRVEVYRRLRVDPKVARRERFAGQGARGTGLFSRRRPGAKPGY